jgi:murein DD-endopeptidase MepM/ murein hydrolase activator NlpD
MRTFTIQNYGTQPLNISQVTVPAGFSIVGSLPNGIPGGSSGMINLQLDHATIGAKGGTVTIFSNDTDNADFEFNIKGLVVTPPAQNTPPEKFIVPIGGVPQVDWAVTAYFDRDPSPGASIDYRGRQYSIDGSTSVHFALPDYAAMDRGVDVYAAAPGTVVQVHDGEFDRHLSFLNPPPPNTPDNYVLIDHGDGWLTRYGRLRNGSVTVTPGQVVAAGQIIGQVGGSGNPSPGTYSESSAFLSFDVTHNGEHIDAFRNAANFWKSPPPFAGDTPGVHYMTTTESMPPTPEAWEGFSTRHVFHPGEQVYTLTKWHGRNRDVVTQYHFYAPNDSSFLDTANTTTDDRPQGWRFHVLTLGSDPVLGTWQVAAEFNGIELGRTSFVVASPSQGLPEIKVYDNTNYVVDGRTTPIDFGTIAQGSGDATRSFTVWNYGSVPLTPGEVTVPEGFSVRTPLPSSISAGGFATLVLQLDDELAGSRSGQVIIRSDDADNSEFNFAVKGKITPVPPGVFSAEFRDVRAPQRLSFAFTHNVSASLSAADLMVERLGPGGGPVAVLEPTYDMATNTATFAFAGILPDGNYRATLLAAGVLNGNTPMAANVVVNFFVFAGDLNHDRTVSIADFITLASHFNKTDATYLDGDLNYDGTVSIADFIDLASKFNTTLAEAPPLAAPQAAAAQIITDSDTFDQQPFGNDSDQDVLGRNRRRSVETKDRRHFHHRRPSRNILRWKSPGGAY